MAIDPDLKDWTWVLDRPCPECGFRAETFTREDVAAMIRANVEVWPQVLAGPDAAVRPDPGTWAPLEYGCHVRDVFRIYLERLGLMLDEDDPHFPNWDQDASAVDDDYLGQDPATVAAELTEAGRALADAFDAVHGDQWDRTGVRSDGAHFTVDTFARYFIHDPIHHLVDVGVTPAGG